MAHCLKHKGNYSDEFWMHSFKVSVFKPNPSGGLGSELNWPHAKTLPTCAGASSVVLHFPNPDVA